MKKDVLKEILADWLFRGVLLLVLLPLAGCDFFAGAQARIQRAEENIVAHDYKTASIELRNALQDEPGNGRARRLLAEVLLHLGDAQGAESEIRRAVAAGEAPAAVAEVSAEVRLATGRYSELLTAIDGGESALVEPQQTLYRGRALQGLQQYAEALTQFSKVLAIEPTSFDAGLGAAEAEAGLGDSEAALSRLSGLTAQEPMKAEAWLARGKLLAARGQFDEALEALNKAQEVDGGQLPAPQQAVLIGMLVEARLAQGDVSDAEAAYQGLARNFPGAPITGLLGARIALVRQDYTAASTVLQKLVTTSPSLLSARFLLGAVSLAQGRLEQADLHLSQVVQGAPENMEARKLLAQVRMRLDRPSEAVQLLMPATESGEFDPLVSDLLATAQRQAGESGQELPALRAALAKNPDSTAISLNLAAAYLREREYDLAIAVLDTPVARRGGIRRYALAIAALAAKNGPVAADSELNRLLREQPDDVDVLNFAAGVFIQRAEFDRGRALLVNALGKTPNHAGTLLTMARLEAAAGNLDVATGHLQKLLSLDPNNAIARLGLADLALRRGDIAAAIGSMEQWRSAQPEAVEPRFRLARLYLMNNQPDQAQRVLSEAIAASPDLADASNAAGSLYLDMGRYEQAVASFRKAVEANSGQSGYWLNLAQGQLALDQRSAARESVNRALALRPEWVPAVGVAALLDLRDNNRKSALARINELVQKRPRDNAVRMLEGDVHFAIQQYKEAAAAYDAAFSLRADAQSALKSYRARYQGKLGQATEPLSRWLAQNPGDANVRLVLAEGFQLSGQTTRAIQEYENVVRDGLRSPLALNNLAWLYLQGKDPRAVDIARRAHEMAPDAPAVTDTYGWILLQNGRVDEALPLLEKAAKSVPDAREIRYHLASALYRTGRMPEARRMLTEVLSNEADFEGRSDAVRLLGELKP